MIPLDKRSHSIRWIFDSHNTIDWNKMSSTTMNTQTSLPSHLTSLKNGDELIWRRPPKDILPVHVVSLQKDNRLSGKVINSWIGSSDGTFNS